MSKLAMNRWLGLILILFFVAIVAVPVVFKVLPPQIWRVHSAKREYESGNSKKAVESLREIVQANPDDLESKMLLSKILAQRGDCKEALKIVSELQRSDPTNEDVLNHTIEVLQLCRRHKDASILYDQMHAKKKPTGEMERILHLNGLAYLRACGNRKLKEATGNIDSAVNQWEKHMARIVGVELLIDDAILIAALEQTENHPEDHPVYLPLYTSMIGFGQFHKTSSTEWSLATLDHFIEKKINATRVLNLQMKLSATRNLEGKMPPSGKMRQQMVKLRKKNHRHRESLAMLLTYRAYLLQKLDQTEKSRLNREYVLGLGYDPDTLLKKIPDQEMCLRILAESTAYLDTRGYIRYRTKQFERATDDMDVALLGIESLMHSPLIRSGKSIRAVQLRQMEETYQDTLAVFIEHHRLAIERVDPRRAGWDARRLRAMGKRPGGNLY